MPTQLKFQMKSEAIVQNGLDFIISLFTNFKGACYKNTMQECKTKFDFLAFVKIFAAAALPTSFFLEYIFSRNGPNEELLTF